MGDFNSDFDRLNAVSHQHAPQHQDHGPNPATIAAVGTAVFLAARSYNRREAEAQGLVPRGWKYPVWGRYILAAAVLHFLGFVIWYGNTYTADDYFWIMLVIFGLVTWIPLMLIAMMHTERIEKHNKALQER
jgi:hypothetical protein